MELSPAKPEHYCTWRVACAFNPSAQSAKWQRMLKDCFANNKDTDILSLQELLGCGLIDAKPRGLRRALVKYGGENCGKSAITKVIAALFGGYIAVPLSDIDDDKHALMPFRRRLPWILDEAFEQTAWHASARVKTLITGEGININVKNGPIISHTWNGPCFFDSNHPVQFKESSRAIVSRLVILHCKAKFDDANPVGVAKWARAAGFAGPGEFIAATELEGVLMWALDGLKRALVQGSIVVSAESVNEAAKVWRSSNLVEGFIEECVDFDARAGVSMPDFCVAVAAWFMANQGEGGTRVPSNDRIGRAIASLHDERIEQWRDHSKRWVSGISLNAEGLKYWEHGRQSRLFEGKAVNLSTDTPNRYDQFEVVRDAPRQKQATLLSSDTSVRDIKDTF
jgi:phage/plasmid-associated DNA primase